MFAGLPGALKPSAKMFLGWPKPKVLGLLGLHSTTEVYAPPSCLQACNYYSPYPNGCAVMSETWNNSLIKKKILIIFHQDADDTQYTAEVC